METKTITRRNALQVLSTTAACAMAAPLTALGDNPLPFTGSGDASPIFIPPGGGEHGKYGGTNVVFKLNKSQTMGNLSSAEMSLLPGFMGAPPHFHKTFDETCIVLQGNLHILVGEEVTEVPAGAWHFRPRGIVHTFWNSGTEPAKFIELYTPGGFEAYLKGLTKLFANNNNPSPQDIGALVQKHDITLRFDLLEGLTKKYNVHL